MSKYRILISTASFLLDEYDIEEIVGNLDIEFIKNPYERKLTEDEMISLLKDVDGVIAGLESYSKKVILTASKLKAIARVGTGLTNIDFESIKEHGIKVSNTPLAPVDAVAEMTLAAMLTLSREIISSNDAMHQGVWKRIKGFTLKEATVLLIGYGRIGKRVSELLKPFGANLLVCDISSEIVGSNNKKYIPLHEGLAQADIISLHASGIDTIIGEREFSVMKTGAVLLNSARGELVDEDALIKALENGKISRVWFDAFWVEPYSGKLVKYKQALLTPHIAAYTECSRKSMEKEALVNLLSDLKLLSHSE